MEAFALESHRRAAQAIDEGRFDREIPPLRRRLRQWREGPRRETSLEKMATSSPSPRAAASPRASPQISDGAAALLIVSERALAEHHHATRARPPPERARRRPGVDAHRAHPGHRPRPPARRPHARRDRPRGDQRSSLRLRRPRPGRRRPAPTSLASTSTGAPLPSATPWRHRRPPHDLYPPPRARAHGRLLRPPDHAASGGGRSSQRHHPRAPLLMDFAFTEEQDALRRATRQALATCSSAAVRAAMATRRRPRRRHLAPPRRRPRPRLLIVPEAHGGAGLGPVEVAAVMEEMGRALPLRPVLLDRLPRGERDRPDRHRGAAAELLLPIASGATTATLAYTEASGHQWPRRRGRATCARAAATTCSTARRPS